MLHIRAQYHGRLFTREHFAQRGILEHCARDELKTHLFLYVELLTFNGFLLRFPPCSARCLSFLVALAGNAACLSRISTGRFGRWHRALDLVACAACAPPARRASGLRSGSYRWRLRGGRYATAR